MPSLAVKCDRFEECEKLREELKDRVAELDRLNREQHGDFDRRIRDHGESIASLRAQVAAWAAIGALAGGGIVTVVSKVLFKV